jgi:hypothetical protein
MPDTSRGCLTGSYALLGVIAEALLFSLLTIRLAGSRLSAARTLTTGI